MIEQLTKLRAGAPQEVVWVVALVSLLAVGLLVLLLYRRRHRVLTTAPASPAADRLTSSGPAESQPVSGPFVEVDLAPIVPEADLDELPFDDGMASTLRSIIAQSPALAVAGAQLHGQAFRLVFSPELQRGLGDGTLMVLPSRELSGGIRSIVVDKQTGHFAGHGILVQNRAVIIAGVFQVLAVITAQKFLADIDKSLRRLEEGIGEIKGFLESEVFGDLESVANTLFSVARAIGRHEFKAPEIALFSQEIQNADRTARAKMGQYRQLLAESTASLERQHLGGFRLRKTVDEVAAKLTTLDRRGSVYTFAARVRLLAASLRGALGLHQGHALDLLEELAAELERHLHDHVSGRDSAVAKTASLHSTFSSSTSIEQERRRLLEKVDATFIPLQTQLTDLCEAIQRTKRRIATQLLEQTCPLELRVQFDDRGQVTRLLRAVPRLEDASADDRVVPEGPATP